MIKCLSKQNAWKLPFKIKNPLKLTLILFDILPFFPSERKKENIKMLLEFYWAYAFFNKMNVKT